MKTLDEARVEIDAIDEQIANLFERRMKAVEDVVAYKKANGLEIFDGAREAIVIKKNVERIQKEELKPYFEDFLIHMMRISKDYQRTFVEPRKIGYQGVKGAFSQIAASHLFTYDYLQEYPTFANVFEAIERGDIDYGVIPFENSYTGEVGDTFDLLYTHEGVYIEKMYDLKVNQNLLGVKGAKREDIQEVYSHPQGLSQCSLFLSGLGAKQVPYANTALAAKHISEMNDKHMGAIASLETAQAYNLDVLASDIANSVDNTTRFMVIQKQLKKHGNRFALLFNVDHHAGSLAEILDIMKQKGFNLENIRSRSTKKGNFQYYFYVELVGNLESKESEELINELNKKVHNLRIVGTYTL